MCALSLTVRFPLGVYYGHRADKSVDFAPSPARLHAALLNSAAQGSHSVDGHPTEESLSALRWLETNPPNALLQPDSLLSGDSSSRFIYRNIGVRNAKRKTEQRRVSDGVAVSGRFGFLWKDAPKDVATTICKLAEDVPCLGEAHSIAIIEPAKFEPNLVLDEEASIFSPGGIPREIAVAGRTDELIDAHQKTKGKKLPSIAADKAGPSEEPRPTPLPRRNLATALYRSTTQAESQADSPWVSAVFFRVERAICPDRRVELCTSMHRALISRIGNDVSPIITGRYLDEAVKKPANRLAIQYLPEEYSRHFEVDGPALVLFVPRGVDANELEQISQARHITSLWGRRIGRVRLTFTGISRRGDAFWHTPQQGFFRLWRPLTPVIPETRRVTQDGLSWSLADSGLLSIAYVWRDELSVQGSGPRKYIELRNQAEGRGASVSATRLITRRSSNYVHRTHDNLPIHPYTALFDLGTFANAQTVAMLGQSRHLGGGLLVPVDVEISSHARATRHDIDATDIRESHQEDEVSHD